MYLLIIHLEHEESKGGKGRDPGECGALPQGREGTGEGSPGRGGGEADPRRSANLPGRHEVLSAEGQPLHRQQEQGDSGKQRG